MTDWSIPNLGTVIDGYPELNGELGSSLLSATISVTNGTIGVGDLILTAKLGGYENVRSIPAEEPGRPHVGQVYPHP
tara:strand:+ start:259 stop:489 length:231 start_codon:yes stop_codon:yes gene_type:complete